MHHNLVEGKVGVLCLAPEEGLGVTDEALRAQHLDQITLFRRHHKPSAMTTPGDGTRSTEIDHVAIAVHDLDGADRLLPRPRTAVEPMHREVVENDGVEEVLLQVADSYIQLLTPVRDDSPVAKYLDKKGEGCTTSGTGSTTAPPRSTG